MEQQPDSVSNLSIVQDLLYCWGTMLYGIEKLRVIESMNHATHVFYFVRSFCVAVFLFSRSVSQGVGHFYSRCSVTSDPGQIVRKGIYYFQV